MYSKYENDEVNDATVNSRQIVLNSCETPIFKNLKAKSNKKKILHKNEQNVIFRKITLLPINILILIILRLYVEKLI